MRTEKLTLIGCGGHSKVVLDAILVCKNNFNISIKDSNLELVGQNIFGYSIESFTHEEQLNGYIHVAIGNNLIRAGLHENQRQATFLTIIHPMAILSSYARIGEGAFIAAKAILAPDCQVGKGSIINHGAIVDHDVEVGEFSHIAPNATLGGNVSIGKGVLIGAGSTVLPGVRIEDGAIVGAGALVAKDIGKNCKVKGVPAR